MLVSSCKTPTDNKLVAKQQQSTFKHFKVVAAEKNNWIGGIAGVRGTNYNLQIKSTTSSSLNFVQLYVEGRLMKVTQKKNNGFIYLSASYSENSNPNYEDLQSSIDSKDNTKIIATSVKPWLTYTLGTSKSVQKVNLLGFKEIQEDNNVKTYPKKNSINN